MGIFMFKHRETHTQLESNTEFWISRNKKVCACDFESVDKKGREAGREGGRQGGREGGMTGF